MKKVPQPDKLPKKLVKSPNLFPVVGIGASAGGLDAFKKLLKAIPEESGIAYVLVQHLDPTHESMLPELLQKVTKVPVLEISDDIKVEPNHIYVIPSNKMMVATDGVLLLVPRPAKSKTERNLPIDLFFASLAEVHQSHAIGVVLSGTGSDGTIGLKAIKDHGGITFAQDEASASYEGMPSSAIQANVVDFILPPEKIPEKLQEVTKIINVPAIEQNLPLAAEDAFKQINSVLLIRKGTDFTYYKQTTIRRRILRRMAINKNEEPSAYLKYLRENKQEQDVLYQDLLIAVTSFFRDPKTFANLCETVFPQILKNKQPEETIRVWVAGCSTGEEAYSIAMCFKEFLSAVSGNSTGKASSALEERVQIFATDLSEPAIVKARIGIYSKIEVAGVSQQRLDAFFTKTNGTYQVKRQVRDMCVFAHHNFLKDPPFGKMDLVSCRNVLIYLEPYLQKKALTTFHYALNPKGFLFLGKSETIGGVPDLYESAAKNEKLYTRKEAASRFMQVVSPRTELNLGNIGNKPKIETMRSDFQKTADDILLSKYTPAGVVVNEAMDIVQFRGTTSNYLEQSSGKPSHNLLVMAKHGLTFELRNILHKVKKEKAQVIKENIPVLVSDTLRNITIEAIPLPNTIEPHYLILFHDNVSKGAKPLIAESKKTKTKATGNDKDARINLLEQELAQTREDMRSITEDQEAANEELQSANEELMSGSEELQSLNEELETSKEELQSTNEELTVVNQEMIGLNEQVTEGRNYAEAIVANIREPLLVLDKNLRIKTANKSFYKTFKVHENETEGLLIYDLGNKQWNIPELRNLLEKILPEKSVFNDFEVRHTFPSIGELIMLLNAREVINKDNSEKLILLSIQDITAERTATIKIEESEKQKAFLLKLSDDLRSLGVPQQIKIKAMQILGEHLNVSRCYYAEVLEDGKQCVIDNSFSSGLGTIDGTYRLEDFGKAKVAVLQRGEVILTADVANDTSVTQEERNRNLEMQIHAYINVPLVKDNKLICLLGVNQSAVRHWTALEITLVQETAERTWAAVERATAEEALRKSEEALAQQKQLLETVTENTDMALFLMDEKQYCVYMNPAAEKMTGFTLEDLKGKQLHYYVHHSHPDGSPYPLEECPIDQALPSQNQMKGEEVFVHKNGSFYPVAFIASPITYKGNAIGTVIEVRETSEEKRKEKELIKSEKQFRQLAELMPQKIFTADAEGHKNYFNETYLDFTGLTLEELKGLGWQKIIHPDDWAKTGKSWKKAIESGEDYEREDRLLRKDGQYLWHLTRAIPLKDENGKVKLWVGSKTEIQEQREQKELLKRAIESRTHELNLANEGLKEKNEELVRMNHELEAFAYVSSHDLQEPLRKIRIFSDMIRDKENQNLTDSGKNYFRLMNNSAERMQALIHDLLAFSRVSIGERKFEKVKFFEIVEEVKADYKEQIEEKQATVAVEGSCEIHVVRFQFKQILSNLFSNALKFTKPGVPPQITVICHDPASDKKLSEKLSEKLSIQKEYDHISLTDNGIGFENEFNEKIFEVFQKLHSKDDYPGTGMGLAIVKKIVDNHHGLITATSELNKGTTFDLFIPTTQ